MTFYEKLQALDRRWIYLVLAIAVIVPLIVPFNSRTHTTKPTEAIYSMIDSFAPAPGTDPIKSDKAVLLSFAHDASTMPELFPMELAILRHCFERNVKVFTLTFLPTAAPIMDYAINTVKEDPRYAHVKSGEHYVNFGYKVGSLYLPILLGMGENIAEAVDTDSEGRKLSSLPIMENITNYNNMNLIIEFSGSAAGGGWIVYARSRFGANVAVGVTAVMAADNYPYIQTGQLIGQLAGLKGAAEYEKLVDFFAMNGLPFSKDRLREEKEDKTITAKDEDGKPIIPYRFKQARIGMNAQSIAHILMIIFILIGNIGYFAQKYSQNKDTK